LSFVLKAHIKSFYRAGEKNTQRGSPRYVLREVLEGKRLLGVLHPKKWTIREDNQ
jgi:hypothetical protein